MAQFDGNGPKYQTCCCGAHITTLASVLIIIDLVGVVLSGSFFLIIPAVVVGVGAYGVFKQSRTPLLVYVVLGIMGIILSAVLIVGLILLMTLTERKVAETVDSQGKRHSVGASDEDFIVLIIMCVVGIVYKIPFTYTYWKMCRFIKDRDMALSQGKDQVNLGYV